MSHRNQRFLSPSQALRAIPVATVIAFFLWLAWLALSPVPIPPPPLVAERAPDAAQDVANPPFAESRDSVFDRDPVPRGEREPEETWQEPREFQAASEATLSFTPASADGRRFQREPFTAAESADGYEILFSLGRYAITEVELDGDRFSAIVADGQDARLKSVGLPELPVFRVDVALPPGAEVHVSLLDATYRQVPISPPLPSAGFVSRNEGPGGRRQAATTPALSDAPFPEYRIRTTPPFQIRHHRGVGVFVYPFHYLPAEGVLLVGEKLLLSLVVELPTDASVDAPTGPHPSPVFETMARRRFINGNTDTRGLEDAIDIEPLSSSVAPASRHAGAVDDAESLLLVVPVQWRETLERFATWKKQRGFRVTIVDYGTTGLTGSAALAATIQTLYADIGVSHIILMGDDAFIPPYRLGTIPSDTLYTLLEGNDLYHDALISRVTANSAAELVYQLDKIVDYEKRPDVGPAAEWYRQAMFVASDEGQAYSAFGKSDSELLDEEIPPFIEGGYTIVDRVYDPGANQAQVLAPWNEGRGYILYLGHGSYTTWLTGNLDVGAVLSLANDGRLPFVLNANCENGRFTIDGQCLAEAMMGAGDPLLPAGAIGVVAATSRADWDPPIVLSQTFNHLLLADSGMSVGALTFHSVQAGMDYCAATPGEGVAAQTRLMEQMHLFGASSLGLRTRPPDSLVAAHPPRVLPLASFKTTVADPDGTPVRGATVCLYHAASDRQIVGRTNTAGEAYLAVDDLAGLPDGAEFILTVYAANAVPVQAVVPALLDGVVIHTPSTIPPVAVGRDYTFVHGAIGGIPPYTWFADSALPPGLHLDAGAGGLSGRVENAGEYAYALRVVDAVGAEALQTVRVRAGAAIAFVGETPPVAMVDADYATSLAFAGDFAPFDVRLVDGELPPGLSLDPAGGIQGEPTRAGGFWCRLLAVDAAGYTDALELTLEVVPSEAICIITEADVPHFMPGYYNSLDLTARGGTGHGYVWRVVDGLLPEGLSLAASGTLSGVATTAGRYDVLLEVEDAGTPPHVGQKQFSVNVHPPAQLADDSLPGAVAGVPYEAALAFTEPLTPLVVLPDTGKANFAQSVAPGAFDWGDSGPADFTRDDGEFTVPLPFGFPFAGEIYSEMTIGQNGYVHFGEDGVTASYLPTVPTLQSRKLLAPLWCDILPVTFSPSGVFVDYTAERARVRWRGTTYTNWRGLVDVGLTLHPDGRIVFHYRQADVLGDAIVGLSGGNAETTRVLLHHRSSQGFLSGWSNRTDIVFTPLLAVPKGLTLLPDGRLQGIPSEVGTHTLSLVLNNRNGYRQAVTATLHVAQPTSVDSNGDGEVDHAELLAAIDRYRRGLLPRAMLDEAIGAWRNPPPSERSTRGAADTRATPLVARTGEVLIVRLEAVAPTLLDDLLTAGYDVATREGQTLTLYCSGDEFEALQAMGLAPLVVDRQVVPDGTRSAVATPVPGYPTYAEITAELHAIAESYPELCRLDSLGASVEGRTIWAVKLSREVAVDRELPEVRLVSTIHGDEKLVTVLALRTIRHLLENYGSLDEAGLQATALLDGREVWFVPLLNPDGYEYHTRYNANGVDLNRSFPDGVDADLGRPFPQRSWDASHLQPETAAIVNWSLHRNFSLCAGLHTGALLIAYPYGNNAQGASVYTATPDDATYIAIANAWVDQHPSMTTTINAAEWYRVAGEMADWAYRYLGMMSITPELSTIKTPPADQLEILWIDNRPALLNFFDIPVPVLRGRVVDAATGEPLYAEVSVRSIDRPIYTHPVVGDYSRLLPAGVYDLEVQAAGYLPKRVDGVVVGDSETLVDVALTPLPVPAVVRRLPAAGYTPAREAHIRLDVAFKEEAPPAAAIVSETIPAGFAFAEAWEMRDDASLASPPLRDDGDAVSWLFWEDDVAPRSTSLVLAVLPGAETTGPVSLSGNMLTLDEEEATLGPESWDMAGEEEFEIVLQAGWNAISSPLVPADPTFASLLPAGAFTPPVWQWGEGGFTPSQTMEAGRGYWLLSPADTVLTVRGTPETRTVRQVDASWRLGGFFAPYAASQLPDGVDAYRWRPDIQAYQAAELFSPGEALWLEFPAPATLDLRHGR